MVDSGLKSLQEAAMNALEARGTSSPQTFVEMQDDFRGDRRLCLTAVAFLPETLRLRILNELVLPLKQADPDQHFYLPESLHVTVQNVRRIAEPPNFSPDDVRTVSGVFDSVLQDCGSFQFELSGLLKLPTSLAVRVFTDSHYQRTVSRLRTALADAGYRDDKTYISEEVIFGNCTFCRYTKSPSPAFVEVANRLNDFSAKLDVQRVSLISTNAVCDPEMTTEHFSFVLNK